MDSQQRAHIVLNLSYVLHERSDSDTVRQFARAHDAGRRRCSTAIRDLGRLPDTELRQRLIVLDHAMKPGDLATSVQIVSVNIGAVDLLPRLLSLAGIWPPTAEIDTHLLDDPRARDDLTDDLSLVFFGAPARLSIRGASSDSGGSILFASAVLRPGNSSILLRVTALESDDETGVSIWQRAARLAEDVIREFPLQWWCEDALWTQPVEETLLEFRSTGNGTTACGH